MAFAMKQESPAFKPVSVNETVQSLIKKHELFQPNSTIIVGLSGGPDSVCLLHILKKLEPRYNFTIIAAHLDHKWRATSHEDAEFCKKYAQSLGVTYIEGQPFAAKPGFIVTHEEPSSIISNAVDHIGKAEPTSMANYVTAVKKYNGSREEEGRNLRRAFLESVAQHYGASSIALGHHQDDQQETFFIRLIRGASVAGLASMRPKEGLYVRPLLAIHKQDIFEYLSQENLPYVVDETNESNEYLRNSIRKVLPAMKACDNRFDITFAKTLEHIQDTDNFLERLTVEAFKKIVKEPYPFLEIKELLSCDPFLHHRLILMWLCSARVPFTPTTSFFNEIIRFLSNQAPSHQLHEQWQIVKKDGYAHIKTHT